jgi:hypothetical protein
MNLALVVLVFPELFHHFFVHSVAMRARDLKTMNENTTGSLGLAFAIFGNRATDHLGYRSSLTHSKYFSAPCFCQSFPAPWLCGGIFRGSSSALAAQIHQRILSYDHLLIILIHKPSLISQYQTFSFGETLLSLAQFSSCHCP